MRIVVVGGGAAGFFAGLAAREVSPRAEVTVLESSPEALGKVAMSGGGRCNLTNATFEPAALAEHYPRGGKALIGPFSRFGPRQTMAWFESRGLALATEPDGRVFPASGGAAAVVGCLRGEAQRAGIEVRVNSCVRAVTAGTGPAPFEVSAGDAVLPCGRVVLAAGGGSAQAYAIARSLGHTLEPPVPSLFGLRTADPALSALAGVTVADVALELTDTKARSRGSLLLTHEGLSGPALLTLSAWAARDLHQAGYRAVLRVNWCPGCRAADLLELFAARRREAAREALAARSPVPSIPQRLWRAMVLAAGCGERLPWAGLSSRAAQALIETLRGYRVAVTGRAEHSGEFVTCGGVRLSEIDMRAMQSRVRPGLSIAGELLDIDGLTGGFNLQAAWTTGRIAGESIGRAAAAGC